jgi:hypothetical protein
MLLRRQEEASNKNTAEEMLWALGFFPVLFWSYFGAGEPALSSPDTYR